MNVLRCQGHWILKQKQCKFYIVKHVFFVYVLIWCRKTRPKSNRLNHETDEDDVKLNCKYISIWMCVTLSCAWLFALSYMLAIVHSEYHELNKDVKKCKYTRQAPVQLNFLLSLKINSIWLPWYYCVQCSCGKKCDK